MLTGALNKQKPLEATLEAWDAWSGPGKISDFGAQANFRPSAARRQGSDSAAAKLRPARMSAVGRHDWPAVELAGGASSQSSDFAWWCAAPPDEAVDESGRYLCSKSLANPGWTGFSSPPLFPNPHHLTGVKGLRDCFVVLSVAPFHLPIQGTIQASTSLF